MKKIFASLTALILLCAPSTKASTDILDLLGGLAGSSSSSSSSSSSTSSLLGSGLSSLISGLLGSGTLTEADIAGIYAYKEPAVTFQSENLLQKAGGAAIASTIVSKLSPYYKKAGIDNLVVTLNSDKTCTFALKKITLKGTYQRDSSQESSNYFIFTFQSTLGINIGSITADVQQTTSGISITFDATKLLSIMNSMASLTGQSTLKTAASFLNSYDGLNCGFALTKTGNVSSTSTTTTTNSTTTNTGASILGGLLGGFGSSSTTTNSNSTTNTTNSTTTDTTTTTTSPLGGLLNLLKH